MPTTSTDQTKPVAPPRGPDRRQAPRRHGEALVHYAEQALLAAALAHANRYRNGSLAERARTELEVVVLAETLAAAQEAAR